MHTTVGCLRSIASAIDCLAACIIATLGLQLDLRKAGYNQLETHSREKQLTPLQSKAWMCIKRHAMQAGPAGWLMWTLEYRNMLVHRGRRLWLSILQDGPVLGSKGEPLLVERHLLAQDPLRSDVEMLLDVGRPHVLTEDATVTLHGVMDSTEKFLDRTCRLLGSIWRARRSKPSLLAQPASLWPKGASKATASFDGYRPGSTVPSPKALTGDLILKRRMLAAALFDHQRAEWPMFD